MERLEDKENKDKDDTFITRSYQAAIMDIATKQNTIIYLPTGSGKTYIAILLIKHFSAALKKPLNEGGKITVFLVNTVALVEQHSSTIRRHTDFRIGKFTGDMNVEVWSQKQWQEQLQPCQIIVLTAQIFLDLCMHDYFSIKQVNLLIFDECHQAVDNHAMRRIMKEFEYCPIDEQPRVLGLTATLLNCNCKPTQVMRLVSSLETTFHSKVATVSQLAEVLGFSTNPNESVEYYHAMCQTEVTELIRIKLNNFLEFILDMKLAPEREKNEKRTYLNAPKISKDFKQMITNILIHMDMIGLYGASKATLFYLIVIERMKQQPQDPMVLKVLHLIGTKFTEVLTILSNEMGGLSEADKIYSYSSPRLLKLLEIIKNFKQKLCSIIFVNQRITAKILYYIIKALSNSHPAFEHVRSDFVVGLNANVSEKENAETLYSTKMAKRVMRKFVADEINLLVASNIVEEGIDIPQCTLVVKFDYPTNYRSYIQSKGRARHKNSEYKIMVLKNEALNFNKRYQDYQEIEETLINFLVGQNANRDMPTQNQIETELYKDEMLPSYYVAGPLSAHVSMISAVSLLNRYCQSLCRDNYHLPSPEWFVENVNGKVVVTVELPVMCPIREPIRGQPMVNRIDAKRAAALTACIRLHKIGQLTNKLLPINEMVDIEKNFDYLFPHWSDEDTCDYKPGTKKNLRGHNTFVSPFLLGKSVTSGVELYLHTINIKASFPLVVIESSIALMQNELVESNLKYALITSNPLPKLCDFPLYLSAGDLNIHINVNAKKITLTHEQLLILRQFNIFVYNDILDCMKDFLIYDNDEDSGCILFVPVIDNGGNDVDIDFNIAMNKSEVFYDDLFTTNEKINLNVTEENYLGYVVSPWYRRFISDTNYIVIDVCSDMSPYTPFPNSEFNSFAHYYRDKYNYEVVNKTQSMLCVKAMSKKTNCLKPRSITLHGNRSKQTMLDGTKEYLIPEMCTLQVFPAALWYKSYLLPSIIHRVEYLLKAEYLRQKINRETHIGTVELPPGREWEPLPVDSSILKTEEKKLVPVPQRNVAEGDVIPLPPATIKNEGVIPANKDYARKMLEKKYPWTDEQEPVDIERNIENVTLIEIVDYEKFIFNTTSALQHRKVNGYEPNTNVPSITMEENYTFSPIKMFKVPEDSIGPQQWLLYQALMSNKANDIVNFERSETLGDSFLKISVTLYLFMKYPEFNEGILTNIKGKVIGNRNLYYIGRNKQFGGMLKNSEFQPSSDWLPPGLCVPNVIKDNIINKKLSIDHLYGFDFHMEEKKTGNLNEESLEKINEERDEEVEEEREDQLNTSTRLLKVQHIRDKTISDCVEALIGTYIQSDGIKGGLALLGWLGVLPQSENPTKLFNLKVPSPYFFPSDAKELEKHLPTPETIEARLGYTFKNKGYLLEALTHASYTSCRLTNCYQRLEFLGDAVLDFLITCHIYEISDNLTPGQLTDLRSALVNNVTFAGISVRHSFSKHIKSLNTKLLDDIDNFVKYQEDRGYEIDEDTLILLEEDQMNIVEHIYVPKALGDLFESLAGAVFLDTGLDLQKTWEIFHRLMYKEITKFYTDVPKNPVRRLYEYSSAAPHFDNPKILENGRITLALTITIGGKKELIHGFGENNKQAKRAAAKMALRLLQKHNTHIL